VAPTLHLFENGHPDSVYGNFVPRDNRALSIFCPKDIEYFADYRQSVGIDVTSLCYDDSPHVKHYSHNKDSYVNSVCNFLNKCLNGSN
jgi:hypothetical protein